MHPAYTRPSARLLRLGAMLYAPLDRVHAPIVAVAKAKPVADQRQPEIDLADHGERKDTVPKNQ